MQRYIDELRLLHAIRLAVVATDVAGTVTFANEAAAEAEGVPAERIVGLGLLDLLVDEGDGAAAEALARVLAGETWRGDLQVRRLDGSVWLAGLAATPIRDEHGSVVGTVVVADDMTDVRAAEQLARVRDERLRLAHRAARLGAWQWAIADGDVVWDERLEEIFGLPPGGYDGTFETWAAMLHPDDVGEMLAIVDAAMASCSPYVLRTRIVHPDGTVASIEAFGEVTTDDAGNATGTIGVVRDVTDEKETARDLERAYAHQRLASARSELLRQVMSELTRADTPGAVAAVLDAHLLTLEALLGGRARLRVPADLMTLADGSAFLRSAVDLPSADLMLLDDLAAQVALAAGRAHHQTRTTEIADQLQSSLAASPLPDLPGVELAVAYVPGGDELEHVGGDWYDAIDTGDGRVALVVGDVMGRGVRAATTMIRVRAAIRGLLTIDPDPAVAMTGADRLVIRDAGDQFVTAVTALIDPARGVLRLCNAGHIPVVVAHPDGTVGSYGAGTGLPLGLVDDVDRACLEVPVSSGSTVVLVTDGVVEGRAHDLDWGIDRLAAHVLAGRDQPLDRLAEDLAALADPLLLDDVTVLVARLR